MADAPKLRSIPRVEQIAWTAAQLRTFLREASTHRLFPAMWLVANTGLRRSELLGLKWDDVDFDAASLSINRGLVAVGYKLHETRGKTSNSRRRVALAPATLQLLLGWRAWQQTKQAVTGVQSAGWVFTDDTGHPIHPHSSSQAFDRIVTRADVPRVRLHDVLHTHGTLLIKAGVPVKVVSERLGHAKPAFTIDTCQNVLPGMQAEAARIFENLINPG